ncbi:MAG: phospholipase [Acidobacteriota bacterium]
MSIERHAVAALVHGRYLRVAPTRRPVQGSPLLVGFHGYGETAEHQIQELLRIPGVDGWTVASVDALHPFYRRKTGEVVRSWMTRDDRERALEDNIRYVASVVGELRRVHGATGPWVVAGFSQGVAMTWRAALRSGWPCAAVIALAGDVPPDTVEPAPSAVPPALLGRGVDDEWYTAEKLEADVATLERLGGEVEVCVFDDGHVWHADFYAAAGRVLARHAPADPA